MKRCSWERVFPWVLLGILMLVGLYLKVSAYEYQCGTDAECAAIHGTTGEPR